MSDVTVYVAVDIVEDQVVRLRQGELKERTVYGKDPVETALEWEREGAEWLHIIDLDGATKGDQQNSSAITEILQKTSLPVQVGGGIRTIPSIEAWLSNGAERVCIGTKSFDPSFLKEALASFGEQVVVAVDARDGKVRVAGWQEAAGTSTLDALNRMVDAGVRRIMYTDIDRDGTLLGPNFEAVEEVLDNVGIPVIASGGISSEHDIARLTRLKDKGLEGVIVGKALYSGTLTLKAAKRAAGGQS